MGRFLSDFKAKYIKHRFFYKLYRILKFRPFWAYASWGEDVIVKRIFSIGRFKKANYKGVFVDVGCNHPIIGNTTYQLYKQGWSGLNLDLTADNIRLCKFIRKRDTSLQRAITQEVGHVDSYIFDAGSGLNTLDKEAADKGAARIGKAYTVQPIASAPLTQTILETLGEVKLDLLNVDVEGHELPVLKSFDFEKFAPDIIVCEIHAETLEAVLETDVYQLIQSHGYHSVSYCGSTAIFARNGFDYIL